MDIWVISSLELLWKTSLWEITTKSSKHIYFLLLDKYLGMSWPHHRIYSFTFGSDFSYHALITWLFYAEVVNTSSVPDLEAQVSQMEKVLSLGGLEPNLAGEMVNRVSKLLHSPPALLAPLAQRYDLANRKGMFCMVQGMSHDSWAFCFEWMSLLSIKQAKARINIG